MKIRIKFSKHGCMKFIGHLDIMRYFQKAHIRAGLDVAYSEGYNPHQIMSFASPLGVGLTSDGEYMDISVHSTESSQKSMEDLNRVMVEGIRILEYRLLPDDAKKSMSLVAAADYYVYPKVIDPLFDDPELPNKIRDFLAQPKILVTKKTKKSEDILDIKPHIYLFKTGSYSSCEEDCIDQPAFFLSVASGSEMNIRPEMVLGAFYQYLGKEFEETNYQIHRQELYAKVNDELIPLGNMGEDIE